jgi:hypothetical protein
MQLNWKSTPRPPNEANDLKQGGFEAEMAKAALNGIANDAPEAAVEVLTEMRR